jgi:hypothetical protein
VAEETVRSKGRRVQEVPPGWRYVAASGRDHYFKGRASACGQWRAPGAAPKGVQTCKACVHRLEVQQVLEAETGGAQ